MNLYEKMQTQESSSNGWADPTLFRECVETLFKKEGFKIRTCNYRAFFDGSYTETIELYNPKTKEIIRSIHGMCGYDAQQYIEAFDELEILKAEEYK